MSSIRLKIAGTRTRAHASPCPHGPPPDRARRPRPGLGQARKVSTNVLSLSGAEALVRAMSVAAAVYLARVLGEAGYGRVELAFNLVLWLMILVRNGVETLVAREIARHRTLLRPLTNNLLTLKFLCGLLAYGLLLIVGEFWAGTPDERRILGIYGLILPVVALSLDFAFRGLERMTWIAGSQIIRMALYAGGIFLLVRRSGQILRVPILMVAGEACAALVLLAIYIGRHGWPRPAFRFRLWGVLAARGWPVCVIQLCQGLLYAIDFLAVGYFYRARMEQVGIFAAAYRLAMSSLAFGIIFQQVIFPVLSRSFRDAASESRRILDDSLRTLMAVFLPLAVGGTLLAQPLTRFLFGPAYASNHLLLALVLWRAPILAVAMLHGTALIAFGRESAAMILLVIATALAVPLTAFWISAAGLGGACLSIIAIGLGMAAGGYWLLSLDGRQPRMHHHLLQPLLASGLMGLVCLALHRFHVVVAVACGMAAYFAIMFAIGGISLADLRRIAPPRARRGEEQRIHRGDAENAEKNQ